MGHGWPFDERNAVDSLVGRTEDIRLRSGHWKRRILGSVCYQPNKIDKHIRVYGLAVNNVSSNRKSPDNVTGPMPLNWGFWVGNIRRIKMKTISSFVAKNDLKIMDRRVADETDRLIGYQLVPDGETYSTYMVRLLVKS